PFAASGTNSLLISSTVESAISLNVQTCTATHRFQPYPQGTPTMPGPYASTGLPSLAALTAASQGSRSQAILAMFVTYSPDCGFVISRSFASFASVCAHLSESAGFAVGGAAASRRPPVTATVATRNAALIFNLVVHMAFRYSFGERGFVHRKR